MLLCYVTDRHLLKDSSLDDLLHRIERAAFAGIDWIQIREKDPTARDLADIAQRSVAACHNAVHANKNRSPQIMVNDRIDVALAAGAAGVHLTEASVPAVETIRWLRSGNAPANFSVGVSCHSLAGAIAAEKAGANYVFFGPVYKTPSKASFGDPQGLGRLSEVCRSVRIPVLAIGGVAETNAADCIHAGASGIAAIRLFQQTADLAALKGLVRRLRLSK